MTFCLVSMLVQWQTYIQNTMHMSPLCIHTGGLKKVNMWSYCPGVIAWPYSPKSVIKAQAMQCCIITVMLYIILCLIWKLPTFINMVKSNSHFLLAWNHVFDLVTLTFDLDLQGRLKGHPCPCPDQIWGQYVKPFRVIGDLKSRFLIWWPWPLTYGLDLQGRPQGYWWPYPDQIWGPYVKPFPRCEFWLHHIHPSIHPSRHTDIQKVMHKSPPCIRTGGLNYGRPLTCYTRKCTNMGVKNVSEQLV